MLDGRDVVFVDRVDDLITMACGDMITTMARGMSLRHIATVTKVGLRYLEYVEEDRFAFLPAPVYLRGFLQEYARLVGIDPRRAADAYMKRGELVPDALMASPTTFSSLTPAS